MDKIILTQEAAYNDFKAIGFIIDSILLNGEFKQDKSNYGFPATMESDRYRSKILYSLQDKYSYGWYITEENKSQQIASLLEFQKYIISNIGNAVAYEN